MKIELNFIRVKISQIGHWNSLTERRWYASNTETERSVSIEFSTVVASIILIAIFDLHLVEQVFAKSPSTRHAKQLGLQMVTSLLKVARRRIIVEGQVWCRNWRRKLHSRVLAARLCNFLVQICVEIANFKIAFLRRRAQRMWYG